MATSKRSSSRTWETQTPTDNRLLSALPGEVYERLFPDLQPVVFPLGKVVYESGGRLEYVYFPTTFERSAREVAARRIKPLGDLIGYVQRHVQAHYFIDFQRAKREQLRRTVPSDRRVSFKLTLLRFIGRSACGEEVLGKGVGLGGTEE